MPWHVDDNHPDCSGYAVVKDEGGKVEGCHDTREKANRQMAALYANEPGRAKTPPNDNLVRSRMGDDVVQLRDSGVDGRTLFGHFAVFNQWAEIDSTREGHFLEQIAPGAFTRSFTDNRYRIKVLYDHGKDPQLGNKPLGKLQELREDDEGGYYEVELIDTPYNDEFVIPAARAGLLGASFRFSVPSDGAKWTMRPKRSDYNPSGLPERTINDTDVFELGPVTWPAYEGATAGVRSGTDEFIESLMHDPVFLARFIDRAGLTVVERVLDGLPPTAQNEPSKQQEDAGLPPTAQDDERDQEVPESDDSPDGQPPIPTIPASTPAERQALVRQIELHRLGLRNKE